MFKIFQRGHKVQFNETHVGNGTASEIPKSISPKPTKPKINGSIAGSQTSIDKQQAQSINGSKFNVNSLPSKRYSSVHNLPDEREFVDDSISEHDDPSGIRNKIKNRYTSVTTLLMRSFRKAKDRKKSQGENDGDDDGFENSSAVYRPFGSDVSTNANTASNISSKRNSKLITSSVAATANGNAKQERKASVEEDEEMQNESNGEEDEEDADAVPICVSVKQISEEFIDYPLGKPTAKIEPTAKKVDEPKRTSPPVRSTLERKNTTSASRASPSNTLETISRPSTLNRQATNNNSAKIHNTFNGHTFTSENKRMAPTVPTPTKIPTYVNSLSKKTADTETTKIREPQCATVQKNVSPKSHLRPPSVTVKKPLVTSSPGTYSSSPSTVSKQPPTTQTSISTNYTASCDTDDSAIYSTTTKSGANVKRSKTFTQQLTDMLDQYKKNSTSNSPTSIAKSERKKEIIKKFENQLKNNTVSGATASKMMATKKTEPPHPSVYAQQQQQAAQRSDSDKDSQCDDKAQPESLSKNIFIRNDKNFYRRSDNGTNNSMLSAHHRPMHKRNIIVSDREDIYDSMNERSVRAAAKRFETRTADTRDRSRFDSGDEMDQRVPPNIPPPPPPQQQSYTSTVPRAEQRVPKQSQMPSRDTVDRRQSLYTDVNNTRKPYGDYGSGTESISRQHPLQQHQRRSSQNRSNEDDMPKPLSKAEADQYKALIDTFHKQDMRFKIQVLNCIMPTLWDSKLPYEDYMKFNNFMTALFGERYHELDATTRAMFERSKQKHQQQNNPALVREIERKMKELIRDILKLKPDTDLNDQSYGDSEDFLHFINKEAFDNDDKYSSLSKASAHHHSRTSQSPAVTLENIMNTLRRRQSKYSKGEESVAKPYHKSVQRLQVKNAEIAPNNKLKSDSDSGSDTFDAIYSKILKNYHKCENATPELRKNDRVAESKTSLFLQLNEHEDPYQDLNRYHTKQSKPSAAYTTHRLRATPTMMDEASSYSRMTNRPTMLVRDESSELIREKIRSSYHTFSETESNTKPQAPPQQQHHHHQHHHHQQQQAHHGSPHHHFHNKYKIYERVVSTDRVKQLKSQLNSAASLSRASPQVVRKPSNAIRRPSYPDIVIESTLDPRDHKIVSSFQPALGSRSPAPSIESQSMIRPRSPSVLGSGGQRLQVYKPKIINDCSTTSMDKLKDEQYRHQQQQALVSSFSPKRDLDVVQRKPQRQQTEVKYSPIIVKKQQQQQHKEQFTYPQKQFIERGLMSPDLLSNYADETSLNSVNGYFKSNSYLDDSDYESFINRKNRDQSDLIQKQIFMYMNNKNKTDVVEANIANVKEMQYFESEMYKIDSHNEYEIYDALY